MLSITQMFKQHVGLPTLTDQQDTQEYLTEREGIRMFDGEQDEATAVEEAEKDLERSEGRAPVPESFELDL